MMDQDDVITRLATEPGIHLIYSKNVIAPDVVFTGETETDLPRFYYPGNHRVAKPAATMDEIAKKFDMEIHGGVTEIKSFSLDMIASGRFEEAEDIHPRNREFLASAYWLYDQAIKFGLDNKDIYVHKFVPHGIYDVEGVPVELKRDGGISLREVINDDLSQPMTKELSPDFERLAMVKIATHYKGTFSKDIILEYNDNEGHITADDIVKSWKARNVDGLSVDTTVKDDMGTISPEQSVEDGNIHKVKIPITPEEAIKRLSGVSPSAMTSITGNPVSTSQAVVIGTSAIR